MLACAVITIAMGTGLFELSGGGNTYVFSTLGPWSDPICQESNSIDLQMDDLLGGVYDDVLCLDGPLGCQAIAETKIELRSDGFTAKINGWGDAIGDDAISAFSRHDIYASMELATTETLRIHASWFVHAAGLGTVNIEMQRLGDIDGPDAPSPPIIDRGASSYIDPISLSGADVLRIPAGRWRVFMYSTHQAMGSKEGFMHGFARTTHIATYVPLGDVNGDQDVNVTDLLSVITDWGPCGDCLADLDGDGQVNVSDLLQVISDWS